MLRLLVVALTLPFAACATDAGEEAAAAPAAVQHTPSCRLVELDREYVRLEGGDFVYVEPQHFARDADGWILAGQPTYRVRLDARGRGGILERGPWFGVTYADGTARPMPMPPVPQGAEIVWVRGAPSRVPGRLGFLYEVAEVAPDTASRFVFAEYDRAVGAWKVLGELPGPSEGRLRGLDAVAGPLDRPGFRGGAGLVSTRTLPVLAVPHQLPRGGIDVLVYVRDAHGWTSEVAWERWVDEIAIAPVRDAGVLLALAGLDPDFDARRASIRTLEIGNLGPGSKRGAVRRHQAGGPGERFVAPVFARAGERLDLGWLRRSPEAPTSAWVRTGVGADADTPGHPPAHGPHLIDPAAAQMVAVDGPGEISVWLTRHVPDPAVGGPPAIVVTGVGPGGVIEVGRLPDPFHGPFAALRASSNELLVVGPEARFDPASPHVRSLVLRLSIRCTP
jgi:hypothetical protein